MWLFNLCVYVCVCVCVCVCTYLCAFLQIHELKKKKNPGVPAVEQWGWWCLGNAGMQVQSLARHSGLRIQHCHSCSLGHNYGLDLIPGLGTPYVAGQPKKGGKKSFLICKTQLYGCQRYQGGRRLQLGFRSKRCWLSFGEEGLSQGFLPAEGRLALLRGSGAQLPPELRFPDL